MAQASVQICVRVSRLMIDAIDRYASEQRLTRAEWIRAALRDQLDREATWQQLEAVRNALLREVAGAKEEIIRHITREIDDLVKR